MKNTDRRKPHTATDTGHSLRCAIKAHPQQAKQLLTGLVLTLLLLAITEALYKIPYRHAAALDPMVHSVKIPAIDDRIPVMPVFFFGYIWSYAYWFFAPFFIVKTGKQKTREFFITFTVTSVLCSLILYFYPAKIDRVAEGLWDPSLHGFFWDLLHICYNVDGGSVSYNLLPSLHCANSVLYYQALRDDKVPRRVRRAALASAVLVIISTLFTKQHFFLDAVTGVLIPLCVRPPVIRLIRLLQQAAGKEAPAGK